MEGSRGCRSGHLVGREVSMSSRKHRQEARAAREEEQSSTGPAAPEEETP
jgi:hypothetical protein